MCIRDRYPLARASVVGRGFMQGLSSEVAGLATQVSRHAFDNGVLLETSGADDQVAKLLPPLTISDSDLDLGLDVVEQAVAAALEVLVDEGSDGLLESACAPVA